MPWKVKKQGKKFDIIRADTGKIVGHSGTKQKAEASVRARYAAANAKGEFFNKRKTGTQP